MSRVRVASWDAKRPMGSELRWERREYKDPQAWLVRILIVKPIQKSESLIEEGAGAERLEHIIKASAPCSLMDIFARAEESIEELCQGTPHVFQARMEFFA